MTMLENVDVKSMVEQMSPPVFGIRAGCVPEFEIRKNKNEKGVDKFYRIGYNEFGGK